MAFFVVSPDEAGELAAAYATASGAPFTAAALTGQAARDEALGMPESATSLRALAQLRQRRDEQV